MQLVYIALVTPGGTVSADVGNFIYRDSFGDGGDFDQRG